MTRRELTIYGPTLDVLSPKYEEFYVEGMMSPTGRRQRLVKVTVKLPDGSEVSADGYDRSYALIALLWELEDSGRLPQLEPASERGKEQGEWR